MAKFLRIGIEEYSEKAELYFAKNNQLTIAEILKRGPTY